MLSETKRKRRVQVNIAARDASVSLLLFLLGMMGAWWATASRSLARPTLPVCSLFDDCIDGCPPDYHCNMLEADEKRTCEPNTVVPGSLEAVYSKPANKEAAKGISPKWKEKDEQGCPISVYGTYAKGKDGNCHWMPKHATLGSNDQWNCNKGFHRVRVGKLRVRKDQNIDYKCALQLK